MRASSETPPQLPISPWLAPPGDPQPPLEGDVAADVAIVGAGYTGLSAALALRRAGADVLVLEREFAGFGASGRNAGHLTPTIGKDLPTLRMLFGEARAAELVKFAEGAVARLEGMLREHGIDCGYQPTGNVMAAVHPVQEKRLCRAAEAAARLGAEVEFLDRAEMRRRGLPPAFVAGALERRGGTLDPGRYVAGLRRAALGAGVRLHEGSAVTDVVDGARPRLQAPRGSVTADAVVLATNAYGGALGGLSRRVVPLHVTLFETAPLGPVQLAALGWPGREGIYTAHESLVSFRLTARGTLLGGSKAVRYAYGGRLAGGSSARTIAANVREFRERFPMLADVPVAHTWGGWIAMTLNTLPAFGATGAHRNVHHALGYNGHGIAAATALGAALADVVLGRPNEDAERFRRFLAIPPEPLRWLLVRGILGAVNAVDRRVDARVRREAAW